MNSFQSSLRQLEERVQSVDSLREDLETSRGEWKKIRAELEEEVKEQINEILRVLKEREEPKDTPTLKDISKEITRSKQVFEVCVNC